MFDTDILKEADQKVKIVGILSENNLEEGSYTGKNGLPVECIRGDLVIKTEETINGEKVQMEIPVSFFQNKYKKDGKSENKLYSNLMKIKNEYASIAAVGEELADRVAITKAKITMNEYPSKTTGEIVSFPRISGTFINKIKKEECVPEATFDITFVVGESSYEMNADGEETGNYIIKGIVPQYGGNVDVVPFKVMNPNVIDVISSNWDNGCTVHAIGKLNFSTEIREVKVEVDFGEAKTNQFTRKVSDLVITGGTQAPLDDEFAYDTSAITAALTRRKEVLDEKKARAKAGVSAKTPPAKTNGFFNPGF